MTLPHTYTDSRNDTLTVDTLSGHSCIQIQETFNGKTYRATVYAPKGADAVALAMAVLEAAGDTGCVVTSWREYHEALRNAREEGARSMRERAAQSAEEDDTARAARIRALPLLPDEEPTEVRHITDVVGRVIRTDRVPLTADTDA